MTFAEAEGSSSSSRLGPSPYRPPNVERSDTAEAGEIAHSLASRRKARRRSFLHPGHHRDVVKPEVTKPKEESDEDDETEEEWVEEDREGAAGPKLARRVWRGLKRDRIVEGPNGEDAAVHLYVKQRAGPSNSDGGQLDLMAREEEERRRAAREMRQLREDVQAEYIWDVLFENQRGILLFGQPLFSSYTLLPFDPSAYTVPSRPLPSATSSFTISNAQGYHQVRSASPTSKGKGKHNPKAREPNRPTKTTYTPATFQTPSPAWTYLTPWLINMRSDGETDELGWEYNYVFRTKGWHSRVGKVGWGGWVRRRGWVRLRSRVLPSDAEAEDEGDPTDTAAAKNEELDLKAEQTEAEQDDNHVPTPEESAASERQELPAARDAIDVSEDAGEVEVLHDIRKAAACLTLDRQKLAMWAKWLQESETDARVRRKLALVCGIDVKPETFRDVQQQFVYTQSRRRLAEMLEEAGLRPLSGKEES